MVNTPGISSQSSPDGADHQSAEHRTDVKPAENSQENLDARLDHAIEETFPTSDPVSVTITKGPKPDRPEQEAPASSADDQQGQSEQNIAEHLLDQVKEALQDVAEGASQAAGTVYSRGEQYMRQAGEHYPQAQHYVRGGQRLVTRHTTTNPLLSLLMAGAVGYILGWMIHGERRDRKPDVPDYGRTKRGYTPHRDK